MPQAPVRSKVWVLLYRTGNMTRVYGVYNSGGTAQLIADHLSADSASVFWVEGARVLGSEAAEAELALEDDAGS